MIGGVTMEIKSPNGQEIHWIREMLRQGMVVGRPATGQFHIGEHLMAKNNLQNSLQFLVLMYR